MAASNDNPADLTSITVGDTAVKSFTYDTVGRTTAVTTSAGTTRLSYDYESRITGITYPNSSTNIFTCNGLDTRVGRCGLPGLPPGMRNVRNSRVSV